MFKSNPNIFVLGTALVLFLNLFQFWGCQDKDDHDPCNGLPPDSCQVDTCIGDTCNLDSCGGIPGQWEFLGLAGEQITSIAFHPTDPNTMYVATDWDFSSGKLGVLYKSKDCGKSWDTLLLAAGMILDITIDPVNPQFIYASPYDLLKSTDGGKSWQSVSEGIQIDVDTRVLAFAIEPWNTNVIYAGTGGFMSGNLYKSTDGGISWVRILRARTEGVNCFELDLKNPGTIYAAVSGGTLMKTTDYGATWDTTGLKLIYELLFDIFIDEDGCIYVAMSGGIQKSCDGGITWADFNQGLTQPVYIYDIVQNSITKDFFANPSEVFLYRRNAADTSWTKFSVGDVTAGYTADLKCSKNQKYLYAGPKGLYRYRFP